VTTTPELEVPPPVSDPPEFTAWVAARGPALQRFAYLVTGRADDAPDLVQEALSRAYPRWARLAATGTVEAYVRRSIVNASITGWRKNRHLVVVDDAEPLVRRRDHHPDPTTRLDDADEAWALVQTLPARQRAAVVLRFYEDQSFAQIALVLDCAEATARSHVHRAVAALRTRLSQEDPDA
jgi:RNA polymerase sigma-70 factor (sigma-E family)